jgi:hypothetical protein
VDEADLTKTAAMVSPDKRAGVYGNLKATRNGEAANGGILNRRSRSLA